MRGVRAAIFAVYVLLWVLSHLLIYASRQAGAQEFNATSVVLLTELVKLVLALSLYLRFDGDLSTLVRVRRPFSRCPWLPTPPHTRQESLSPSIPTSSKHLAVAHRLRHAPAPPSVLGACASLLRLQQPRVYQPGGL